MINHYFTSDPHVHHRGILRYTDRHKIVLYPDELEAFNAGKLQIGKEHTDRMNVMLVNNINKTVPKDGVLHMLGDIVVGVRYKDRRKYIAEFLEQINCKNVFCVYGNHDSPDIIDAHFTKGFVRPILLIEKTTGKFHIDDRGIGVQAVRKVREQYWGFSLDHYAQAIWRNNHRGYYGLYGHSHRNAEGMLNAAFANRRSMDSGIDNAFELLGEHRPFSLPEVLGFLEHRAGTVVDHHQS